MEGNASLKQGVDHYQVLKLAHNASTSDVKKAFHQLAKQFHPDLNQSNPRAEEKFKQINESYGVLSDPQARRLHDIEHMQSATWKKSGTGHRSSPIKGKDILQVLSLSLKELLLGTTCTINFERPIVCSACDEMVCDSCNGEGQRKSKGVLPFKRTCERCDGRGEISDRACETCHGAGFTGRPVSLDVEVKPGLFCGDKITLKGEGAMGRFGGTAGDLFLEIVVPNSATLSKRGDDLYLDREIKISDLLLGCSLELQELGDDFRTRISPLTKPDTVLRIRERGFLNPDKGGKRGDLLVQLRLKIPKKLSQDELQLLKKLVELNDEF